MAGQASNGYVKANALVAIAVPVIGVLSGSIYLFVNLSIAPLQKDITQNHDDIRDIRGQVVPRAEHDRDWASQDRQFADLQRQINENRSDLHAIYSPNDQLKSLSDRLDKMEIEIHGRK